MQRVGWLVILLVLFPSSPSPSAPALAPLCIALVDTLGLASAGAGSDSKHALQRPHKFFCFLCFKGLSRQLVQSK